MPPDDTAPIERRLEAFLDHRMPEAEAIRIDELARIHGGSSQETFRLRARWREAGTETERRLILRRAPAAGLVVAERDVEFRVYRGLAGRGIPVPKAWFLELDPRWLDRPFFLMEQCDGACGNPYAPGTFGTHARLVAEQFWRYLGRLATVDHRDAGLEDVLPDVGLAHAADRQLDHWEASLDAGETVIEPAVRGAIRRLRRRPPPPPPRVSIVHGDYRAGNFLWTGDGRITAILDWEMCHLGDPLEDIAWALNDMWSMAWHLPVEEGLAIWEEASGMRIDRAALDWWRLFAPVKACGLWTTAGASFAAGRTQEMILALSCLRGGHFHRGEILRHIAERRRAA